MQEEELLITWVGWFLSWVYTAEFVTECITQPPKTLLSDDHHFEVIPLKSQIAIEEAGFEWLILDKNKMRLEQNVWHSLEIWLGNL